MVAAVRASRPQMVAAPRRASSIWLFQPADQLLEARYHPAVGEFWDPPASGSCGCPRAGWYEAAVSAVRSSGEDSSTSA